MNHTLAPWEVLGPRPNHDKDKTTYDCAIEFNGGGPGTIIAECFGRSGENTFHDSLANATLMAAAPELFECLGLLVRDTWGSSTLELRHRCEIVLEKVREKACNSDG